MSDVAAPVEAPVEAAPAVVPVEVAPVVAPAPEPIVEAVVPPVAEAPKPDDSVQRIYQSLRETAAHEAGQGPSPKLLDLLRKI